MKAAAKNAMWGTKAIMVRIVPFQKPISLIVIHDNVSITAAPGMELATIIKRSNSLWEMRLYLLTKSLLIKTNTALPPPKAMKVNLMFNQSNFQNTILSVFIVNNYKLNLFVLH